MDIPIDILDITFNNATNGTTPQVEDKFTWLWMEGIVIVLSAIAILINIAAFLTLKMFKVCSSAMLITLMTMILGMRVTTEVLKLVDDQSNDVKDFKFHIRVTHDISDYFYNLVIVILFFQWL